MIHSFRKALEDFDGIYLTLEVSGSSNSREKSTPILPMVQKFIEDQDLRVLSLFGDTGSGKTLFCLWLGRYLLEKNSSFVPIYIDCPNFWSSESLESYTRHKETILFLLDGYDNTQESSDSVSISRIFCLFPNCKMIITRHSKNALNTLEGMPRQPNISELYIRPLSIKRIKQYISKVRDYAVKYSAEEQRPIKIDKFNALINRIQSSRKLKHFLATPLILHISVIDIDSFDSIDDTEIATFNAYLQYMDFSFARARDKLLAKGIDLEKEEYYSACTRFAFEIIAEGYAKLNKDERLNQIMICCPLKEDFFANEEPTKKFTFVHSSISDFLVALDFKLILDSSILTSLGQMNEINICDRPNIRHFIKLYLNDDHRKFLLAIIKSKKTEFKTASANAITILNDIGHIFKYKCLIKTYIPGSDLSKVNLTRSDLVYSDLRSSKLKGACLHDTNLSNCNLLKMDLGGWKHLKGHSSSVNSVSFSVSGRICASGSSDGTLRVWDLQTSSSTLVQDFSSPIFSVSISQNEKLIALGLMNECLYIYHLQKHSLIAEIPHPDIVYSVCFAPDGNFVASGCNDGAVRIFDLQNNSNLSYSHPIGRAHVARNMHIVCYSYCGRYLACTGDQLEIVIWDMHKDKQEFRFKSNCGGFHSLSFSPDSKFLASGTDNNLVILWDLISRRRDIDFAHKNPVVSISFSQTSKLLASGSRDYTVKVWNLLTSQILCSMAHPSAVLCLSFSPDGQSIVSGCEDKTLIVWNINDFKTEASVMRSTVREVCFSSDRRLLLSASDDKTLRVQELETDKTVLSFQHPRAVRSLSISPDDQMVASGCMDHNVRIWSIETGELVTVLQRHSDKVNSVCFSRCGNLLVSGGKDNIVIVWELENYQPLCIFGHFGSVLSVCFSPCGKLVASSEKESFPHFHGFGRKNCKVIIWNVPKSQKRYEFEHQNSVRSVCFASNDKLVASASFKCYVKIWNLQTGTEVIDIKQPSLVFCVRFSPDCNSLVSAGQDKVVREWSLLTGGMIRSYNVHSNSVLTASYSSDGKLIASGGRDCNVRVWKKNYIKYRFRY